jgi:hypothetical protein
MSKTLAGRPSSFFEQTESRGLFFGRLMSEKGGLKPSFILRRFGFIRSGLDGFCANGESEFYV